MRGGLRFPPDRTVCVSEENKFFDESASSLELPPSIGMPPGRSAAAEVGAVTGSGDPDNLRVFPPLRSRRCSFATGAAVAALALEAKTADSFCRIEAATHAVAS